MLKTVTSLLHTQHVQIRSLEEEVKELKKRLHFRHTEINDLRYKVKQIIEKTQQN